jgi:hypothetical protein
LEWQETEVYSHGHEGQGNFYVPLPSEEKSHFSICEPPKNTTELYNHRIMTVPEDENSQKLKSFTWLDEALKDEVKEVMPSGQDINDDGTYNVEFIV